MVFIWLLCNFAFYHLKIFDLCSDLKLEHNHHQCSDFMTIIFQSHIKKVNGQIWWRLLGFLLTVTSQPLSNFHYFNLSKLRGNDHHELVSERNEKVYCTNSSTKIIRSYFFSTDFYKSLDFIQNNRIPKFQSKRNILPYLFCKWTTLTF